LLQEHRGDSNPPIPTPEGAVDSCAVIELSVVGAVGVLSLTPILQ